ncbi:MAG: sigma-54-dependent Fis family transcriptional regulator [Calditrichaeota bacterium]|nr:MAG: sigma-54-dependent Fis family transcriptional regulator [Calditrichota bacterium]MBL1204968.1 sigma-54-dependent Fis family transcriptional regulator [Calditrichota bacterium]NOG44798.1 sigma-54-dependent Fis family transcriptional regulator [Calditrichota bacterium]
MQNPTNNILIVDNETSIRQSITKVLERSGYSVFQAESGRSARKIITEHPISVIISDLSMPVMDGMELLKSIKNQYPLIEFIMITGHGTIERAVEAIKSGAYDFISKPFKRADIIRIVEKALVKFNLATENRYLKQQLAEIETEKHNFIGNSQHAVEIKALIQRIANTPSNILVSGESGTGKEVIARLIHTNSNRNDKPFVAVNCGAISDNLIESELFGHLKGSFTGAIRDKDGLFISAKDGTLFLDEISTIPINLQVKLLRALEEHEVMPVGATKTYPVAARIIAATNQNLQKEVAEGRFREDLFFRLNVIEVNIPPLRQRAEDIQLLVTYFINRINKSLNKNVQGFSANALHLLHSHSWPGNVRELENVVERAMIFCDDELIHSKHLPPMFSTQENNGPTSLKEAVAHFEMKHINSILSMTQGDKKEAAKMLDLGVSSLYRKISELGIEK